MCRSTSFAFRIFLRLFKDWVIYHEGWRLGY
jgi:hypothetical protein